MYRVLDAALNRVCEGLRVCEEMFRFAGATSEFKRLKELRHKLRRLLSPFKERMLAERDAQDDVGRHLKDIDSEFRRKDEDAVFEANIVRAEEGMRVLEEVLKSIDAEKAKVVEQMRFGLYTLQKEWSGRVSLRRRLKGASLYCIVSEGFGVDVVDASERLAGIADVVQLRMKEVTDAEFLKTAERVKRSLERSRTLFIVNDRADIAAVVGADGVHLGADDIGVTAARRVFRGLVGATVHNEKELKKALEEDADYLGVGSFYPSAGKQTAPVGGLRLAEMMRDVETVWFAIGGIDEGKLEELVGAGVRRICVMSAVVRSDDIGEAASRLKRLLSDAIRRAEA